LTNPYRDGLTERRPDRIGLPEGDAWLWDGVWRLDPTLDDGATSLSAADGCWSYAVDFPRTYAAAPAWNSCVRRRRWIRHRRYRAARSWLPLPAVSVSGDDAAEPFIDVAAGGHQLSGAAPGYAAVWAVTINGSLLYRFQFRALNDASR